MAITTPPPRRLNNPAKTTIPTALAALSASIVLWPTQERTALAPVLTSDRAAGREGRGENDVSDYASNDGDGFIGELGGDLPPRDGAATLKAARLSAKAAADSVREAAEIALGEASDRVRSLAGEAAEKIQHRYGDLEVWARLKPARAVGVAAGVGVLLGLLLRGPTTRIVYVRDR